jgi:hypothetical protein
MSNHLAAAAVTASLKQLVQDALDVDVPGASAKVGRPETASPQDGVPTVNLFLYQVTPNAAGRNDHLAARGADGRLRGPSVVALELHYLLSFYGPLETFTPERLLASVARALEHKPILTRALLEKVIQENPGLLDATDLQRAREPVRATPVALGLDEMSKLWSVLFQVPYVLSVAYRCAPIFIETSESGSPGLPVTQVGVGTLLLGGPTIERVEAEAGPGWPILWNGKLSIRGAGLNRSGLGLRIGGRMVDPSAVDSSATRIVLPLTSATFGGAELEAGSVLVELVLPPPAGAPAHHARVSDSGGFALRSSVSIAAPPISSLSGTLDVGFAPAVTKAQTVRLLLNQTGAQAARSYSLTAQPLDDNAFPAATLAFTFSEIEPGTYQYQAVVNGTASAPLIDANPASATYRQITGPTVTFP